MHSITHCKGREGGQRGGGGGSGGLPTSSYPPRGIYGKAVLIHDYCSVMGGERDESGSGYG